MRIADNGVTVFQGSRRTVAPSGSFSVERLVPNRTSIFAQIGVSDRTQAALWARQHLDDDTGA